jgi:hypothetical protein
MAGERYVVLGLAPARADWFRQVGQWANSAAIPAEFVKCVSADEARARLASGRPFSALVADAGLASLDRDLVDAARRARCPVLVAADGRSGRDWLGLGAAAVLPTGFDRRQLLDALAQHARLIGRADALPAAPVDDRPVGDAQVVAVCGPGGTGASTVAIAAAQGLAAGGAGGGGGVLLADLARHAEQAMLHDARDVVPGVQELVDGHRAGRLATDEVRGLAFDVVERGYHLLLGLRRARFWPSLAPRAFEAGFDGLCRAWAVVVCDIDADVEGEEQGGSVDVEERNVMARTAIMRADVVLAVGLPTMKGLHSLVRVVHDVVDAAGGAERVVPVLNRAPRSARSRAGLTRAVSDLAGLPGLPSPVFLPERRVEEALRDGVPLPASLASPVAGAVGAVAARRSGNGRVAGPVPVEAGSVGTWSL